MINSIITSKKPVKLEPNDGTSFLKQDGDMVVFTCPKAQICIPNEYLDKSIATINGSIVTTVALLQIAVWNDIDTDNTKPEQFFFKYEGVIDTHPSSMSYDVDDNGDKMLILEYRAGDPFIVNVNVQKTDVNANKILDLITYGYLPNVFSYDEIADYFVTTCRSNEVGLGGLGMIPVEMIISELCRDPNDLSKEFRYRLAKDPDFNERKWKIISADKVTQYSSTFASISSGNARGKMISIISKKKHDGFKDHYSPLEDIIS